MPDVSSVAAAALKADQSRLEIIARNVANAATPGYRRQVGASLDFAALLGLNLPAGATPSVANAPARIPQLTNGVDATPGALNATGRALDLALEGVGYFVVGSEGGQELTRAGGFHLDPEGWLVDGRGRRVQGRRGDIQLASGQDLVIDSKGSVAVGGVVQEVLRLAVPTQGERLQTQDGIYFTTASGSYVDAPLGATLVRSGFLEASNASGVRESLGMVETSRHFESVIRLLQGYDEVMGRTIQRLGDF